MSKLSFKLFNDEINEFSVDHPKFRPDQKFVFWFLRAFVTEKIEDAADATCGGKNDKNIDGIFIDYKAQLVYIIQGKYHQSFDIVSENRNDIIAFAQLSEKLLMSNDEEFESFASEIEPHTATLFKDARKLIINNNFGLFLYYVSTGKCNNEFINEGKKIFNVAAKTIKIEKGFSLFDSTAVSAMYHDYLDGVAPPIPEVNLEMESGTAVKVNGILQRYDHENEIESWVFSMKGNEVANIFIRHGTRLFARNIRGFLGFSKKGVNERIVETINNEPDKFFYYNNGITIICDSSQRVSKKGKDVLVAKNPQIINGQQTTRSLAEYMKDAAKASVLIKVIQIPPLARNKQEAFESLVNKIVAGTNYQNTISQADLKSNDRTQIQLERELRKKGYVYMRKRQTKAEAKKYYSSAGKFFVSKEDFAQASAACMYDQHRVRSGVGHLFADEIYDIVFPHTDILYYLTRYWLMKSVGLSSRKKTGRGYAKWMVVGILWNYINPLIQTTQNKTKFIKLCESNGVEYNEILTETSNILFNGAEKFYKRFKGRGDDEIDISQFYRNKKGRNNEFEKYITKSAPNIDESLTKQVNIFQQSLLKFKQK